MPISKYFTNGKFIPFEGYTNLRNFFIFTKGLVKTITGQENMRP